MTNICLIHLVRKCNGIEAFRSFVASYQQKVAGIEHELLLVYKGFDGESDLGSYRDLLEAPNQSLLLEDKGLDIGSYLIAANHLNADYLCFLNSFSLILESDWLKMMYRHAVQPDIGIVSATGSWESHLENHLNLSKTAPKGSRVGFPLLARRQMRSYITRKIRRDFSSFPNYHLRSNAFMISRQLFLSLRQRKIRTKDDALKFESGRNGMTQQILQLGLRPVVVGRDGRAYDKEEWPQSRTFRSGNQENLLVADNQTQRFQVADAAERKMLSQLSWGPDFRL